MTPRSSLTGMWAGGFDVPGGWRFMRLQGDSDGSTALADVLFEGESRLDDLAVSDRHVTFTLRRGDERWLFEGEREGDAIIGSVTAAERRGSAVLLRTESISDSRAVRGTYGVGDGSRIAVFTLGGLPIPGSLGMFAVPTGEVRGLLP